MSRFEIIVVASLLLLLNMPRTNVASESRAGVPRIIVTRLDITDNKLELSYEIRNTSGQNNWILTGGGKAGSTAFVFMGKDNHTLLIQNRLDIPMEHASFHNVNGRYALLCPDQVRKESVVIALPVYPEYPFGSGRRPRGIEYATRIAIQIGYYSGNLPGMIRSLFEKAEGTEGATGNYDEKLIKNYFKGPLHFNKVNEILRERDEEILIPYTDQTLQGEKVLRKTVESVRIPYEEKDTFNMLSESIKIPSCKSVQVHYKPSMLDYYYPYKGQQSLLSNQEKESLQAVERIVVEDQKLINSFLSCVNNGSPTWGIVRQVHAAYVNCYDNNNKSLAAFSVFDDFYLVINERGRFVYPHSPPGLKKLTPQIKPFEIRIQCAANLKNLFHRLRLCHEAHKKSKAGASRKSRVSYPISNDWCDEIVRECHTIQMSSEDIIAVYVCPGVKEAKKYLTNCCYAMNPNCQPDSSGDVVLLFETKAGWNQHGGPKLFTFDNHDPKGGCVLLNDGTVRFIRTEKELRQLRWK